MNAENIHRCIVRVAEQLQEHVSVLEDSFSRDEEGFRVHDGSDLADALLAIDEAVSTLSRLAFKISNEA